MNPRDKIKAERQGERFIALSDIMIVCGFKPSGKAFLAKELKDLAAEYWLKTGGKPEDVYRIAKRSSLSGSDARDSLFSQAFINNLLVQGKLEALPCFLDSPFFASPKKEQQAIMDGLAKGEPLEAKDKNVGAVERLAIRAGLKDEIFR